TVPARLPGEDSPLLLPLGLDERVPRLPHDGAAAPLLDVVVERLRALHLADDGGAGMILEDVAGEEEQELVAPEDLALLVHRAEAIGVAVEGDPQIGALRADLLLEVLQVLGDRRVGVMIGKG